MEPVWAFKVANLNDGARASLCGFDEVLYRDVQKVDSDQLDRFKLFVIVRLVDLSH